MTDEGSPCPPLRHQRARARTRNRFQGVAVALRRAVLKPDASPDFSREVEDKAVFRGIIDLL